MEDKAMKKFNSIMLLFAALSIFAGCKKEALVASNEEGPALTSFVAYLDATETKTNLDGVKVYWSEGDEVSVNGKLFVATPDQENPAKAMFNLKDGQTAPTGTSFRASYPSSTYSSTSGRITMPTSYTYDSANLLSVSPMYATFSGNINEASFQFKNVCALLELDLKGEEQVKSVVVTANTNIGGGTLRSVAINATSGALTYSVSYLSSKTVTINCATPVQLDAENVTKFYVPVPERALTTLSVAINTAEGKTKTLRSTAASMNVVKNNIYRLPLTTVAFPILTFNAQIETVKNEAVSPTSAEVAFDVTPEDNSVYYMFAMENKGYVDTFNGDMLKLAQDDIAYWQQQGVTALSQLLSAGIAHYGPLTNYAEFTYAKPNSDYVAYAYAVDADFNVSPAVAIDVHTPEYVFPTHSANYEDYLGEWIMGDDVLVVTERVNGVSYNIAGIKNQSFEGFGYTVDAVVADFVDGYISLKEQKTDASLEVGTYGICDIYLSGEFNYDNTTYAYYPFNSDSPAELFRGAYQADGTVKVTINPCAFGDFVDMCFSWVIREGANAGKGNSFDGTTLGDMRKFVDPYPAEIYGSWHTDLAIDRHTSSSPVEYNDWTMKISRSGLYLMLDGFDIAFDAFLATQDPDLKAEPAAATLSDDHKTLTVKANTETGIGNGTTNAVWRGRSSATSSTARDIVFAVDLEAKTIQLTTFRYGVVLGTSWYSDYRAADNLIFTQVPELVVGSKSESKPKRIYMAEQPKAAVMAINPADLRVAKRSL